MLATLICFVALQPQVQKGVVYSRLPEIDLAMDVYQPPSTGKMRPCFLVLHGGAWMMGKRSDMGTVCEALAKRGYVAATATYRLAPNFVWPSMLDDAQTAVRFLRANAGKYQVDPNQIAALGASAGGQLSLLLGMRETRDAKASEYKTFSSRVGGVVDIFGPTDLSRDFPPSFDLVYQMVLGKPKQKAAKEIEEASPLSFASAGSAPVFILHGEADSIVPIGQSKLLYDRLKSFGVPVESAYIAGMGHDLRPQNTKAISELDRGVRWIVDQMAR